MARLAAAGCELLSETPQAGAGGCLVCFVHPRSTGGVLLELSQPGMTDRRKHRSAPCDGPPALPMNGSGPLVRIDSVGVVIRGLDLNALRTGCGRAGRPGTADRRRPLSPCSGSTPLPREHALPLFGDRYLRRGARARERWPGQRYVRRRPVSRRRAAVLGFFVVAASCSRRPHRHMTGSTSVTRSGWATVRTEAGGHVPDAAASSTSCRRDGCLSGSRHEQDLPSAWPSSTARTMAAARSGLPGPRRLLPRPAPFDD
jgi:hypothetical protein